jgi:hypothetical protein
VLPQQWQAGRYSMVRDLVDREDVTHVPLRVSCTTHGAGTVDRERLMEEIRRATRHRHVSLEAVCPV